MRTTPLMQKRIGILGGSSNVATAEYYQMINAGVNRRLGGWEIAETLIAGMNFGNIEAFIRDDDWPALSAYLEGNIDRLVAGGADFIICVSNTLHKAVGPLMQQRDCAFLHIADPTAAAIRAKGLTTVALLGTRTTMGERYMRDYYATQFGLDIVVPDDAEQADIDRIIFNELCLGRLETSSRMRYLEIVDRLARDAGAEGLILGCTEIFLLIDQSDRPDLPMFNTTALHCAAIVDKALG
ncbi:amino acid racemase [Martelella sp. HB161492]|uniref:aspartate/glutamate racemase family protein n=1 Tax=Martelella sp. HB161492 TaxID=2720726 RepID=UPI00159252A2|nr:amino acid racemase [Martelella sp. HB161492]